MTAQDFIAIAQRLVADDKGLQAMDELARFVHEEIAKWAKAVKDSGATVD